MPSPARTSRRCAAAVIGLLSAALYWWIWGSWHPAPAHVDETAYLVQARIYAAGEWTAAGRPLPEFFEQLHVLVTPVLAAKYPPGHSLLLAPGMLLGAPWVVPLLLTAVTGALVFLLVERVGGWVAGLLAWLVWLVAPLNLAYRPSYLSNVSTTALWLAGWWAFDRWWERGDRRWLLLASACTAWCILVRPLTGLVYATPIVVLVVLRARRSRCWRDVAAAVVVAAGILSVLPYANYRTTGRWTEMPWAEYARLYAPYDRFGFGFDSTPPIRRTPDALRLRESQRLVHKRFTPDALPRIAEARTWAILMKSLAPATPLLLACAFLGLITGPTRIVPAVLASVLLVAAHLSYAHDPGWLPYYLELVPVLAMLTALGFTRLVREGMSLLRTHPRARLVLVTSAGVACGWWLVLASQALPVARTRKITATAPYARFAEALATLPARPSVVFVRKGPRSHYFQGLVVNEPDLARALVWIAHDLGGENARLLALAPDRRPFVYDEARQVLVRVPR